VIERQCAIDIRELALKAVSDLSSVLEISRQNCSEEEYERFRKGVGLAIGHVQTHVLGTITAEYPDLDDLR
jgi:hypothetical protein